MNLFDWYSNLSGKIRAILTILGAIAGVLTSPALADVPYVSVVAIFLAGVMQTLTRFTTVGNGVIAPPPPADPA